jgi:hypothetical protein
MRSKLIFLQSFRFYSTDSQFNELLSLVKKSTQKNLSPQTQIIPRFQVVCDEIFLKSKSFFVEFNDYKYLFNCNELLNRHLLQYNLQNIKFENVFITQKSWSCISGLTSYIQASIRRNTIRLHAPYKLKELMNESNFVLQLTSNL